MSEAAGNAAPDHGGNDTTMETHILDDFRFEIDLARLQKKLRVRESMFSDLEAMAAEAQAVARPRALYGLGYIDAKTDDTIEVEGIVFHSRVLRVNLDQTHRVFPYVATCGQELETWSKSAGDLLQTFWADGIKEMAVYTAAQAMTRYLRDTYGLGRTAAMAPGSLADWPIQQQRPLFSLLGDVQGAVGVELTQSFLMVPSKSVSGMLFPTESSFESCQLCPRPVCVNRRAPYDKGLFDRKYRAQS